MSRVYFSLGSNLGHREQLLCQAIAQIKEQIGMVESQSAFYTTAPWGFESPHPFLNAVLCCSTSLTPSEVLTRTQAIEKGLGRTVKSQNGCYHDRTIDIDLLLFDNLILQSPALTLPHPLMHQRTFVLEPLCEIAPELEHPVLHQTMRQLLTLLVQ